MTGIHPYCLLPLGRHPPAGLTGVDGRVVSGHDVGPFTVWASALDRDPALDLERVEQHHSVVREAASGLTPVPVRFGGWVPDEGTLRQAVLSRSRELEAALAAVSDRVEFGVRFSHPPPVSTVAPSPAHRGSGRAYLRARARELEEQRRRKGVAKARVAQLSAHLSDLVVDQRVTPVRRPEGVSVAHLVARSARDRYLQRVESFLREEASEHEAQVTGPWPPYSFTPP